MQKLLNIPASKRVPGSLALHWQEEVWYSPPWRETMKVVKIQKNTKPQPKAKTVTPAVAARMRYAAGEEHGGGFPWLGGIVVISIILLVVGIAVAKASRSGWPANSYSQENPATNGLSQSGKYESQRYDELGGLTISEWMKKNNTNNALLKARLDGVKARNNGK
jgi:hypothetical protein